jgi:hypothetical protein
MNKNLEHERKLYLWVPTIHEGDMGYILLWLERDYGYWGEEDAEVAEFLTKEIKPRMDESAHKFIVFVKQLCAWHGHIAWWLEILGKYGMPSEKYKELIAKQGFTQYYCHYYEDAP